MLKWFTDLAKEGKVLRPFRERPILFEDLSLAWETFWALCPSRNIGFGVVGSIPFSEISSYLLTYRQIRNPDVVDETIQHVMHLDAQYVEQANKKDEGKK
jgi:hypothetical protein